MMFKLRKSPEDRVKAYIKNKTTFYISDVAYDLNLDYDEVARIIRKIGGFA